MMRRSGMGLALALAGAIGAASPVLAACPAAGSVATGSSTTGSVAPVGMPSASAEQSTVGYLCPAEGAVDAGEVVAPVADGPVRALGSGTGNPEKDTYAYESRARPRVP